MKYFMYFIGLLVAVFFNCCSGTSDEKTYVILEGKVIDRESKALILKKTTEDTRYQGIEIPISDSGNFKFEMEKPEFIEEYELVFMDEYEDGAWRPISFFPESDTVRFELYPRERFDENQISGSELSKREEQLRIDYSSTFGFIFDDFYAQRDSLRKFDTDSEQIEILRSKIDSLYREVIHWRLAKCASNADLFSYIRFIELIKQSTEYKIPVEQLSKTQEIFRIKYPDHPYSTLSENLIEGVKSIHVGGNYIDFIASDSSGNEVILSTLIINNNVTLIDLWAPWCGPCIKKSKEVQKVYSEINPMGFDVVAVVGGIKSEDQYFNALRKYNYPWPVLMELQNENRIWEKYNIDNSGGSQFLINAKGEILAINPSIEQIKEAIEKS
ncbi:MAG: TlpA family protein disulfide reductase [Bacteroidota bacterium]